MTNKITIENWCLVENPRDHPYLAPELRTQCLRGQVYNHPGRHHDGKMVITSALREVKMDGKEAITGSGNHYVLGEPDKDWIDYIVETYPEKYKDWDRKSIILISVVQGSSSDG